MDNKSEDETEIKPSKNQPSVDATIIKKPTLPPLTSFEMIRPIGQGGMAQVWLVKHKTLEALRVIKILKPALAQDQDLIQRFIREAKVAANLNHKNIVRLYQLGIENEIYYLEMEYVEGKNLTEILKEKRTLPWIMAALIIDETAQALDYAHQCRFIYEGREVRGIIHRDIKPGNIMLTPRGEIKLMDFGIARIQDVNDETIQGSTLGTIAYMAPEQIDGKGVDPRTDLFALGSVFYELLTGQKLFDGPTMTAVFKQMIEQNDVIRKIKRIKAPVEILNLLERCLQQTLEHRIPSARHISQQLQFFLHSIPNRTQYLSDFWTKKPFIPEIVLQRNRRESYLRIAKKLFSRRILVPGLAIIGISFIFYLFSHLSSDPARPVPSPVSPTAPETLPHNTRIPVTETTPTTLSFSLESLSTPPPQSPTRKKVHSQTTLRPPSIKKKSPLKSPRAPKTSEKKPASPALCHLHLITNPAGSSVIINNKKMGKTPLDLSLLYGFYNLTLIPENQNAFRIYQPPARLELKTPSQEINITHTQEKSHYLMGLDLENKKEFLAAIAEYEQVRAPGQTQDPQEYIKANTQIGYLYQDVIKDYEKALAAYLKITHLKKNDALYFYNLAYCYLNIKKHQDALSYFEKSFRFITKLSGSQKEFLTQRIRFYLAICTEKQYFDSSLLQKEPLKKNTQRLWQDYLDFYQDKKEYAEWNQEAQVHLKNLGD